MGKNGQLFIVQDYIEYNSQDSTSVLFYSWHWIVLLAAFTRSKQHFCLVCYLEPVLSVTEPVLNEWSCPLLKL